MKCTVSASEKPTDYYFEIDESISDLWSEGTFLEEGNTAEILHIYIPEGGNVMLLMRPTNPDASFHPDTDGFSAYFREEKPFGDFCDWTDTGEYLEGSTYGYSSEENAIVFNIIGASSTLDRNMRDRVTLQPVLASYAGRQFASTMVYIHVYDSLSNIVPKGTFEKTTALGCPLYSDYVNTLTVTPPALIENVEYSSDADWVSIASEGNEVFVHAFKTGATRISAYVGSSKIASFTIQFTDKTALNFTEEGKVSATVNFNGAYILAYARYDASGRMTKSAISPVSLLGGVNLLDAPFPLSAGDKIMLLDTDFVPLVKAFTVPAA